MDTDEFKSWLIFVKKQDASSAQSRVSNCLRVEQFEGNLDIEFQKDRLKTLLNKLIYKKVDFDLHNPMKHKIPIKGNWYTGTATLKQAITLYQEFLIYKAGNGFISPKNTPVKTVNKPVTPINLTKQAISWDVPSDDILLNVAKLSTPYIRFLDKQIVAKVIADNENHRAQWIDMLEQKEVGLAESYIWENGPCCFPGVRRKTGNFDNNFALRKLDPNIKHAFVVDDNSFPRQIWSFLIYGKKFANHGPDGYSLAHLLDHKEYKNNLNDILVGVPASITYWGLFTCLTNTVYIPNMMIRPTDFTNNFLTVIIRKCFEYYSGVCNPVPAGIKLKSVSNSDWETLNFPWGEPFLPTGYEDNLEHFLIFRNEKIAEFM